MPLVDFREKQIINVEELFKERERSLEGHWQ